MTRRELLTLAAQLVTYRDHFRPAVVQSTARHLDNTIARAIAGMATTADVYRAHSRFVRAILRARLWRS